MTLLPLSNGHGIVEEREVEVNYVHNWLYSVIPADEEVRVFTENTETVIPVARAYLTGFCRECRKAFTHMLQTGWGYVEQQLDVPVYGCVKPGTYR